MRVQIGDSVVNIHSFVDVITNSSSVAYILPSGGCLQAIVKLCRDILDALGKPNNVQDYFDIEFDLNSWGSYDMYNEISRFVCMLHPDLDLDPDVGYYDDNEGLEIKRRMQLLNEYLRGFTWDIRFKFWDRLIGDDAEKANSLILKIVFKENKESLDLKKVFEEFFRCYVSDEG